MDTLEVVYYTCLNNDCPKHRNVFMEDDPEHENCARERLWLEGQRPSVPQWVWFAAPLAFAALAAGAVLLLRMARPQQPKRRSLHEDPPMKTWSGAHAHRDEREGSAVPPPIS